MIDRLLSFLKSVSPPGRPGAVNEDDPRLAAAALMVHLMDADGDRHAGEMRRLRAALSGAFDVRPEQLSRVIADAEEADRNAIDLYAFTSVINRHLDGPKKLEFMEILWEIVYADGVLHEIEDNIVWRVAELIGVDSSDRVALRRMVAARMESAARGAGEH